MIDTVRPLTPARAALIRTLLVDEARRSSRYPVSSTGTAVELATPLLDDAVLRELAPQIPNFARTDASRLATAACRARSRRMRRLGITALVSAAATAALVIAPTLSMGGGRPTSTAAAAQVLIHAGAAAGDQPGGSAEAPYWHSVSTYEQGGQVHQREIWMGHRTPGVLKDEGVRDGALIATGVAIFGESGAGLIRWDDLAALPTDPQALEAELRAGINGRGSDDDSELFVIVGDLLRESPAEPPLREALWNVAAAIPGITLIGAVTDSAGRSGTAVERLDANGSTGRYILDPTDGRLLEESISSNDSAEGQWRATYLEQNPAETAPALPESQTP